MKQLVLLFVAFIASTFSPAAFSTIIGQGQFVAPLSPQNPKGDLRVVSATKANTSEPIWVKYEVIALSAEEKPKGRITIDAAPELVQVAMSEEMVHFSADDMELLTPSGKFGEQFKQQAGDRTSEELNETFGNNLGQAIAAFRDNKGAMLEKTIIKTYSAPPNEDVVLLASVLNAEGIYPAFIQITMGQGDMPVSDNDKKKSLFKDKFIAILIGFGIAGFLLFRKFTK